MVSTVFHIYAGPKCYETYTRMIPCQRELWFAGSYCSTSFRGQEQAEVPETLKVFKTVQHNGDGTFPACSTSRLLNGT